MSRFAIGALIAFFILLGGASLFYTFSKCGTSTLFLGNGATYAAVSGMCDE